MTLAQLEPLDGDPTRKSGAPMCEPSSTPPRRREQPKPRDSGTWVIEVTDKEVAGFFNDSTGEESDSVHLVSLTTMSG